MTGQPVAPRSRYNGGFFAGTGRRLGRASDQGGARLDEIAGRCRAPIGPPAGRGGRRQGHRYHGSARRARAAIDARRHPAGNQGHHAGVVSADHGGRKPGERQPSRPIAPQFFSTRPAPEEERSTNPPDDVDSSQTQGPVPATIEGTSNTGGRPTWAEVARNQSQVPLDESIQRAAADVPASGDQGVVTLTGKAPAAKTGLARFLGGSKPPTDEAAQPAVCRFDPGKRQTCRLPASGRRRQDGLDARHRRRRDSPRFLGQLVSPPAGPQSHTSPTYKNRWAPSVCK